MEKLKTAIIDVGSNTIRLVMYEYSNDEGLKEVGNIKTVARLRTYLLPSGEMSEEGIQLLSKSLSSFKKILQDFKIKDVKAAATAAVRQAINNEEIIQRMTKETGIKLDILSEDEEAYFGFLAVVHSMSTSSAVTIDIGGGSTEITLFENKKLQKTISFPFGTVSLKQNFVKGEAINSRELEQLKKYAREQFRSLDWIQDVQYPIVAIGGSARNVAQIHQQKINYPISGVHEYEMYKEDIAQLLEDLQQLPMSELRQLDGLSSDRADIIVLALVVFDALMEVVVAKKFQITKKGLREGLIYSRINQEHADSFNKYSVFEDSTNRIVQSYGRTLQEAKYLEKLTQRFYEECTRLKLLVHNDTHLSLIKTASKMFSIGEYIELESTSQHTFYLIANQSIPGVSHVNRVKLALLASYKNKDYFSRYVAPFATWISKEEIKQLREYGAMLRFVYAMNITKRNIIKKVDLELIDERLILHLSVKDRAIAELYEIERQKKHIEKALKVQVELQVIEERSRT